MIITTSKCAQAAPLLLTVDECFGLVFMMERKVGHCPLSPLSNTFIHIQRPRFHVPADGGITHLVTAVVLVPPLPPPVPVVLAFLPVQTPGEMLAKERDEDEDAKKKQPL